MNSKFNLIYDEIALRQLKKMDKQISRRIIKWITDRLVNCKNPRLWGSALKGYLGEFWRYKIGDYRILCRIQDKDLIILVLTIGNRKEVYKD